MEPKRLSRSFILGSRESTGIAILKISVLVLGLALAKLTYDAIMEHPSSRSNFFTLVSTLKQPRYLPALLPLLLIPFVPPLRAHFRWALAPCLIAGIFLNSFQWGDLKIFHASHRIKLPAPTEIANILRSEEDAQLRQYIAPFLDLRPHLQGAALMLPQDTPIELDSFRLFRIALVDRVERVPFKSEITPKELDTFASRPGVRHFPFTGLSNKDRRYIFIAPTSSKVYRVYTSDRNLVLAEEGYVVKQSD
jgi:hypothetical protein